jgi:hypothetical protein
VSSGFEGGHFIARHGGRIATTLPRLPPGFTGTELLLGDFVHIPVGISLGIFVLILTIAVVASILKIRKDTHSTGG